MIEIAFRADRLPLQVSSRLLNAPGTWSPDSRLEIDMLGAVVTPPLGWQWDGQALSWASYPGAFIWTPPRRPLRRFLKRMDRKKLAQLPLYTITPDDPKQVEKAVLELENRPLAGYLLWDAMPATVTAARRGGLTYPVIAEVDCTVAASRGESLVEAGADALWIGPPVAGRTGQRLWGPAVLPLLLAALENRRLHELEVPLIAGAGCSTPDDARHLRAAGAALVALDPAWWVQPSMAKVVAAVLQEEA